MATLSVELRGALEQVVRAARKTAEVGARKALEQLAVPNHDPWPTMTPEQQELRRRLRARGRQLGDRLDERGTQRIEHLVGECAYEQWHRMLFARFLAECGILIEPASGVSISVDECKELARERRVDWITLASGFAQGMLPQIFRSDDAVLEVELPAEHRQPLERLLMSLSPDVFLADDSLGWVYQFWQSEEKGRVNESGTKIGAEQLPAVTQLFTEDYMVQFLIHNTLGAWWAGRDNPKGVTADSEAEARAAVALPGIDWEYLRFVRKDDRTWYPAAGSFADWPRAARDLRVLDPCMGSGHFLVFILPVLAAMRCAEDGLSIDDAQDAVLRENIFGLEIDPRCTQIAAFNLALAAWKVSGWHQLPSLNVACSGVAPNAQQNTWVRLAGDDAKARQGMERLYRLFAKAPLLGSLINPKQSAGDLLESGFEQLEELLERALATEPDESVHEMAVSAKGIAKAARLLSGQFTLVITNVPFLGYREMAPSLVEYIRAHHTAEKGDLGYCLWRRSEEFVKAEGGTIALVTLQHWLSLRSYTALRKRLLTHFSVPAIAHLGTRAFETISGEKVNVTLTIARRSNVALQSTMALLDVARLPTPQQKAKTLKTLAPTETAQCRQFANPDHRISFGRLSNLPTLSVYAECLAGIMNGDSPRFIRYFWEIPQKTPMWAFLQSTVSHGVVVGGLERVIFFDEDEGHLREEASVRRIKLHNADERGNAVWGRRGVAISQMSTLPVSLYFGNKYDSNVATIVPKDASHLSAIWAFCSSTEFHDAVRAIDRKLNVTNATFGKVPFDLEHWKAVAQLQYPEGPPRARTNDPTQWIFDGLPQESSWPLQVAVARLLGYRWPRQTGSAFPDCPSLAPDKLEALSDDDGIVCIPGVRAEEPAAGRLRAVLAAAYGTAWDAAKLDELLRHAGFAGRTLDEWLRAGFFEQHCSLFTNPFIWHVWDGQVDGFHALLNYHRLTRSTFEKLTYAYLGDWIRRQEAGVQAGEAGSEARLVAAQKLQDELKRIIEGEPPYDIFVRWKPLCHQPIGWEPDLNDGVSINIRPLMLSADVGRKGAGVLRAKPNISWDKDRGTETDRSKDEFPWYWGWDQTASDFGGGARFDGKRWNALHYSREFKTAARRKKRLA